MGALLGRWFTFDALKAIGWAVAGTAILGFAIAIYHDVKTSGATTEILKCQQAVAEGNQQAATQLDTINAKSLKAAQSERDKAKAESDQKAARIVALESSLKAQLQNPICWPRDIARSLRQ